jgi:hypothetical protein
MKRRKFIAGLRSAVSVGATLRGLLLPVNGVLVADHMVHSPDADEGYDYDDVEHGP